MICLKIFLFCSLEHRRTSREHLPTKVSSQSHLKTKNERTFTREPATTPCNDTAVHGTIKEQRQNQRERELDSNCRKPSNFITTKKSKRRSKGFVEDDLVVESLDHPNLKTGNNLLDNNSKETYLRIIDDLCKEVDACKRSLLEERETRIQAERRVYHLEKENKKLRAQLNSYKMNSDHKVFV